MTSDELERFGREVLAWSAQGVFPPARGRITSRRRTGAYDRRNRRTDTVDRFQRATLHDGARVVERNPFETTSSGRSIARSEPKFDERGLVHQPARDGMNTAHGTTRRLR